MCPICLLNTDEMAEAVLLYIFRIGLQVSLLILIEAEVVTTYSYGRFLKGKTVMCFLCKFLRGVFMHLP